LGIQFQMVESETYKRFCHLCLFEE